MIQRSPRRTRLRVLFIALWLISASLLTLGLSRPMIKIAVNVEGVLRDALDRQPVVGLLLQEHGLRLADISSKLPPTSVTDQSIVSSVIKLFQLGSYTAASLILIFSVLVPVVKQLVLLFLLLMPHRASTKLGATIKAIHKWSMLDVFVLSTVVLALSSASAWHARLLDGFFWFLGYFFTAGILGILLARQPSTTCDSPGDLEFNEF